MQDDSTPPESLLAQANAAKDKGQLLFFDLPEVSNKLDAAEVQGEFTGERLFSRKPEIYEGVVRMLADGLPDTTIARYLKVSTNTVDAVRKREGESIEDVKKEMQPLMQRAKRRLLGRIRAGREV